VQCGEGEGVLNPPLPEGEKEQRGAEGAEEAEEAAEVLRGVCLESVSAFEAALCDDMNTPKAAAALFKLVGGAEKALKRGSMTASMAGAALAVLRQMDLVLGVLYEVPVEYFNTQEDSSNSSDGAIERLKKLQETEGHCPDCSCGKAASLDALVQVQELASRRAQLKQDKDYAGADRVREEISALGYGVKDSKEGFEVFLL
jgi:cysteinyl-tRNA synthetase